eukprot:2555002-Pyramimonas_sp.AAC.1
MGEGGSRIKWFSVGNCQVSLLLRGAVSISRTCRCSATTGVICQGIRTRSTVGNVSFGSWCIPLLSRT